MNVLLIFILFIVSFAILTGRSLVTLVCEKFLRNLAKDTKYVRIDR